MSNQEVILSPDELAKIMEQSETAKVKISSFIEGYKAAIDENKKKETA